MGFDSKSFDSKQMASDFLDGHLSSEKELDALLSSKKAKKTYSRYQMVSQLMKSENALDLDISDSVNRALQTEATIFAPSAINGSAPVEANESVESPKGQVIQLPFGFKSNSGKRVAGFAIAASVAVVALFNANLLNPSSTASDIQPLAHSVVTVDQVVAQPNVASTYSSEERQAMSQLHQEFIKSSQDFVITTVSNQKVVPVAVTVPAQKVNSELKQEKGDILKSKALKKELPEKR